MAIATVNACDWSVGHSLFLVAPQPLGLKELINSWKSKDIAATVPERTDNDNLRTQVRGFSALHFPLDFLLGFPSPILERAEESG